VVADRADDRAGWASKFPDDVEHSQEQLDKLEKCFRSAKRVLELYGQRSACLRLLLSEDEAPITFKGVNSGFALCCQDLGLDADVASLTNESVDSTDTGTCDLIVLILE
jgi:hypothetical protein